MDIKQAKRLKKAGWEFDEHALEAIKRGVVPAFPRDKEMMVWLCDSIYQIQTNVIEGRWLFQLRDAKGRTIMVVNDDLTEVLVQSCIAILKSRNK